MIRFELSQGEALLRDRTESPRLDAELLLCHLLGWTRAQLRTRDDQILHEDVRSSYETLLRQRADGVPVAYLVGYREFWKHRFEVSPGILVPRPETELLVEAALQRLQAIPRASVLDLGTGSGAIGLSLALDRPDITVDLVDNSPVAVAVAERNRVQLGAANAVVRAGRWYDAVADRSYDLIVSNPPYIAADDPHLPDLRHEPREALVAADAGLSDLQHIIVGAASHLRAHGTILLEHGCDQGPAVRQCLQAAGFQAVSTLRDLSGLERATTGLRPD